ncbi:tetratricopeptide repeat protein [Streptomyces sp. NBC_00015]|uniref:tetratricopeptide repeat protein n=1 Tax=Streptomyces sp. NBC_00015 TaxID=2903611 RepID=UPI003245B4D0
MRPWPRLCSLVRPTSRGNPPPPLRQADLHGHGRPPPAQTRWATSRSLTLFSCEAWLLTGLGQLRYEQDDFEDSYARFGDALRLFEERGGPSQGAATALAEMGTARREQARYAEALELLGAALERFGPDADRGARARVLYGIGYVHREQGAVHIPGEGAAGAGAGGLGGSAAAAGRVRSGIWPRCGRRPATGAGHGPPARKRWRSSRSWTAARRGSGAGTGRRRRPGRGRRVARRERLVEVVGARALAGREAHPAVRTAPGTRGVGAWHAGPRRRGAARPDAGRAQTAGPAPPLSRRTTVGTPR